MLGTAEGAAQSHACHGCLCDLVRDMQKWSQFPANLEVQALHVYVDALPVAGCAESRASSSSTLPIALSKGFLRAMLDMSGGAVSWYGYTALTFSIPLGRRMSHSEESTTSQGTLDVV